MRRLNIAWKNPCTSKIEAYREHQQGHRGTYQKLAKERIEDAPHNFTKGYLDQEEDPKTPNEYSFIPNLIIFIIHVIVRG